MKQKITRSCNNQEFRALENDSGEKLLQGHPVVFSRKTDIAGFFEEIIEPGALNGADLQDVPLFVNHDAYKIPLARSRRNNGNSTMTLTVDDVGLFMDARVDVENNPEARTLYSAVQRGDVAGMSFCFTVADERWENLDSDYPTRHINKIEKIYEVSAVNNPAYTDTDINARGAADALDSARRALDSAQAEVDTSKDVDILKLKAAILAAQ